MKNWKAAGSDGIQNKAYLYSGRAKGKLIKIIMKVWRGGEYPEDWRKGMICPIYKKGEMNKKNNYREITPHNGKNLCGSIDRKVEKVGRREEATTGNTSGI